ncbi:MAG: rubredoxin [Deltaproteobacteria bacterium]|nr:rubredoxin [Deltaproteobacteria bacterium]
MNIYVCTVCGYEYNEKDEGTKWEDLPEDWICPTCGVSKDAFEKKETD